LQKYPDYDESKLCRQEIEFVIQVSSKIRAKINLPADTPQEEAERIAKQDENVSKHLEGKTIKKIIFVQNKLINFIV
jgi:leucyl-tRNA synthetase